MEVKTVENRNIEDFKEIFKKEIKTLLGEFPGIRFTGDETGAITDDSVKALTFSVMYETQKIIGGI